MKKTLIITAAAAFMMSGFVASSAVAGPAKKCTTCHNFTAKHKIGPGLAGIVGREAGKSGFKKHKPALAAGGWVWDEEHLLKWICNSKDAIKEFSGDPKAKTKMPVLNICGEKGKAIVAFLKTI